jgi:hypothetical protein
MKPPKELELKLKSLGLKPTKFMLAVNITDQSMTLFEGKESIKTYTISSSARGTGQVENTNQTPLGLHRISNKIGGSAPICAIFKSREDTGDICPPGSSEHKDEDLILSRILRIEGLEEGFNKGRDTEGRLVDSFERFIYLHGTNREDLLGTPASHGCLRMGNLDVMDLFDRVPEGTLVWIA